MSLENIQSIVLDVLKEVQTVSGREWTDLSLTAAPIHDLDGFDSLCSVEATVMLEEKLGRGEFKKCSLFISDDSKRALTILEISQMLEKLINAKEGST